MSDFADLILSMEQQASQGFLLEAVRKRFDSDLAFRSATIKVWWDGLEMRHHVQGSFPFAGKSHVVRTWVDDEALMQMKTPADFRTIVSNVHRDLRNAWREQLQAEGINELPLAESTGGAEILAEEPTPEQAAEILDRLRSLAED